MRDAYGRCWLVYHGSRPHHFVIVIHRAHGQVMRQVLLHEWAHVIAWSEAPQGIEDHGPEWGLAMARAYQAVVER